MNKPTVLVTGASGALGQLVVHALGGTGGTVIAGSRTQKDAQGRHIDFDDAVSLLEGFRQVDRLLLISTDALADPGKRQRQHRSAIHAARQAGVGYVAYTSMPNPATSHAIFFAGDHVATEAMLASSGMSAGILRNGWYQENLLAYLPQIIADGTWFTAAGAGRIPHVARADAASAAAALLQTATPGIFDIAGPQAMTIEDIASAVNEVLGRKVHVTHVDANQLAVELARQGVPAPIIPMIVATDENQRAGGFDIDPGMTRQLIGRPPQSLQDFLHTHAEALLAFAR